MKPIPHACKEENVELISKQKKAITLKKGFTFKTALGYLTASLFLLFYNDSKAQTYVTGSVTIFGSSMLMGDVVFDASSRVEILDGAEIILPGDSITLESGAEIYANAAPSITGTGRFSFEGNSGQQILNGGNSATSGNSQPVVLNMTINNANGVALYGNNSRVSNTLNFVSGHLYLGDLNLELASGTAITNATENSYLVTNGSGVLLAEDITPSSTFTFPVGRAIADYTPVTLTNLGVANDNYYVRVKNYSESLSNELVVDDGVDRSWNIYSDNGSNVRISLQHNDASNGSTFVNSNGFVTRQLNTATAEWMLGPPILTTGNSVYDGAGSIAGSQLHSRDFNLLSTASNNDQAWFSISSNPGSPLPVSVLFNATWKNKEDALLKWEIVDANKIKSADIYRSFDGNQWKKTGTITYTDQSANSIKSNYTDKAVFSTQPQDNKVYYRLHFQLENNEFKYSAIRSLSRNKTEEIITLYPNPANNEVSLQLPLQWSSGTYQILIFDYTGRKIYEQSVKKISGISSNETLTGLNNFSSGNYVLTIQGQGEIYTTKLILWGNE